MLLWLFLLFFLCARTVTSFSTGQPPDYTMFDMVTDVEETLSSLQLVATPDYPVAQGQRVDLHCTASIVPNSVTLHWYRLDSQIWKEVKSGSDLTLTEPEQSGLYRCQARGRLSLNKTSPNRTVYIVPMPLAVVGQNLGIAAFFLVLLSLILNLAVLVWLFLQRFGGTVTASDLEVFPNPENSPTGCLPKTSSDGEVYMNYTNSTNEAYSDLDPANISADNVYASLS